MEKTPPFEYRPYTRETLATACGSVLGQDVVDAMLGSHISMPMVLDTAAKDAFVWMIEGPCVDIIRSAMLDLKTHSFFQYQDAAC